MQFPKIALSRLYKKKIVGEYSVLPSEEEVQNRSVAIPTNVKNY